MEGFKKYKTVIINNRKRITFIRTNSKSNNPIEYIKCNSSMITYKQFLKSTKMIGGGVNDSILNKTVEELHKSNKDDKIILKGRNNNIVETTYNTFLLYLDNNEMYKEKTDKITINNIYDIVDIIQGEELSKNPIKNPVSYLSRREAGIKKRSIRSSTHT